MSGRNLHGVNQIRIRQSAVVENGFETGRTLAATIAGVVVDENGATGFEKQIDKPAAVRQVAGVAVADERRVVASRRPQVPGVQAVATTAGEHQILDRHAAHALSLELSRLERVKNDAVVKRREHYRRKEKVIETELDSNLPKRLTLKRNLDHKAILAVPHPPGVVRPHFIKCHLSNFIFQRLFCQVGARFIRFHTCTTPESRAMTMTKDPISRFTQDTFYEGFYLDLWSASSHVIICSPFIRLNRLNLVLPELIRLISSGVRVCVFLQNPAYNGDITEEMQSQTPEEFNLLVGKLESAGAHVVLRHHIHQKIAIIDGKIVWEGSLNILSFSSTREQMLRDERAESADWMQNAHNLFCPQCRSAQKDASDPLEWFGQQFAKCRDASGLTQIALAEKLEISQGAISQIEHGQRNLKLDDILLYAGFMCFDIAFVPNSAVPRYTGRVEVKEDGKIMTRDQVCQQLEDYRKKVGMSKVELAKRAKISRTHLDEVLKEKLNVNTTALSKVASGLGLTLVLLPFKIYSPGSPIVKESGPVGTN